MECLTEGLAPREVITCRMSLKTKVHREIGHMFLAAQGPTKESERLRVPGTVPGFYISRLTVFLNHPLQQVLCFHHSGFLPQRFCLEKSYIPLHPASNSRPSVKPFLTLPVKWVMLFFVLPENYRL